MQDLLFVLWFFVPAGLANASPVFAVRIKQLDWLGIPLDRYRTFRGKRILGDHKTIRGFVSAVIVATATILIQVYLYNEYSWVRELSSLLDYSNSQVIFMGAFMGFGAMAGDSIKSFFKRQFSIPSGKSWFPYDQLDYIVGALLASLFFVILPLKYYLLTLLVWFMLHIVTVYIGWLFHYRNSPI